MPDQLKPPEGAIDIPKLSDRALLNVAMPFVRLLNTESMCWANMEEISSALQSIIHRHKSMRAEFNKFADASSPTYKVNE